MDHGGFPSTMATFGGITIDVDPVGVTWGDHDRHRGSPPDTSTLTTGALYRDFVFGPRNNNPNGGIDITLSGLLPSTPYYATIWSFDTGSRGNRVSDWFANGVEVVSNYSFDGSIPPTSDGDNTLSFQADSDGGGALRISGRGDTSGLNDPSVFFNAITLSDEPPPPPPPPPPGALQIDFGSSVGNGGGPGGTQDGFLAFEDTEGGGNPPKVRSYDSGLGVGGTVDITIAGFTHFRDYRAVTGTFADQSPLLSDMVLRNADGEMTLTLEDLLPGVYDVEMFHHSSQFGGGSFDIELTDSRVTDRLMLTDVPVTDGTNPSSISTSMLRFVTDGSPVRIDFLGGSGDEHVSLNGFVLTIVPEPSTLLIWSLLAGLGIGCPWRRRR